MTQTTPPATSKPSNSIEGTLAAVRTRLQGQPLGLMIGGRSVEAADARREETNDPSSGAPFATVPVAGTRDVEEVVEAARRGQRTWHSMGLPARRVALRRLGERIAEHIDELAMLDALDSGNPFEGMKNDIARSLHQFTTWPGVASMIGGSTVPIAADDLHFTEQVPYGVVVRITAYNHPAYFAIKAMLPPLTAGNAVVLKPADQTPLSSLRIGELAAEVLPPGVVSVLTGGGEVGDLLVRHPAVKRIGFTGSVATGRKIQQRAAEVGVKQVSLELGGKNAIVVLPDAPLSLAADAVIRGMNLDTCQGQSCGSTSRVFAHRAIRRDLVEAVGARLDRFEPAPAYLAGSAMGPLITRQHADRVLGHVRDAKSDGARLVSGEAPLDHLPPGYYVRPALFDSVDQSMRIAQEEIFGPVISVLEWHDVEDMLAQVNSVDYGLTGSVWTGDLKMALRIVRGIDSGYVWVNDVSTHYWGLPFGGTKQSGIGREECVEELLSYSESKAVSIRTPWTSLDLG